MKPSHLACALALTGTFASATTAADSLWSQLHADDLPTYAANLRAAGFPEPAIGVLISQELNERFAERERALQPSARSDDDLRKFWSGENRAAWVALHKEKSDALRRALGVPPDQRSTPDWVAASFPRLSATERAAVRMICEDYDQMVRRVSAEARGIFTDDDRAMLDFLQAERIGDLRRILNDDELFDYRIKRTMFGSQLRLRVECFEPTAGELRTLHELGVRFGLDSSLRLAGDPQQRQEAQAALEAELVRTWSPPRMAELRRSLSTYYQTTYKLVRRLNLPRTVADQLFESQMALGQAAMEVDRTTPRPDMHWPRAAPGTRLSPDESAARSREIVAARRAQLQPLITPLLEEHLARARALLGDSAFPEYCAAHQQWIETIRGGQPRSFQGMPGPLRLP